MPNSTDLPPRADSSSAPSALPGWLAIALVAGSSAAVLVLEILAGRLLAPYVGVSLETYTGIIGTILAGIAAGAWAGGVLADRVDPRRLLPPLLMIGGALAIATIPTVRIIGGSLGDGGGGLAILVLAALGFLPSATVLSAVPPTVIKLQLRDLASTGSTVGRLSAWSTGGAIFGTFFTGFVLVAAAAVSTLIVSVGLGLIASGFALWAFGGRRGFVVESSHAFSVVGIAGAGLFGTAVIGSPCDTQTSYYCLSVQGDDARPSGRVLVLDDLRHSYVDLDDPTHLEFWYIRRLADAIGLAPRDDVVFLGGGALTLPRYVRATSPATQQIVFEIDEGLIEVVESEFGFEPSSAIDVQIGDARLGLVGVATDSADVVIGDAFGSRSVPFHLATEEFIRDVRRVLRPAGMYAVNVIDAPGQHFLAAQAATLDRVFEHVVVVRGPQAAAGLPGNSVVIASDGPIDAAEIERLRVEAGDGGETVVDLGEFIDGAPIITDDFAPVDQLIAIG
ncbi:MAG TPA: fused MFS/spermidine synthase [Ilumatobacter sp.]|nr:fused MFS/spermidine synthase [Ilumatobacter sp.]